MTDQILYQPIPVSIKPEKEGLYVIMRDKDICDGRAYFSDGEWFLSKTHARKQKLGDPDAQIYNADGCLWLKTVPLSELLSSHIKELVEKSCNTLEELIKKSKGMETQSLGQKLKECRDLSGLTLRQVEDATQISNAYLSQLENDKIKMPSANVLYKLANIYGITIDSLLLAAGIIKAGQVIEKKPGIYFNITPEEEGQLKDYLRYLRHKKR